MGMSSMLGGAAAALVLGVGLGQSISHLCSSCSPVTSTYCSKEEKLGKH
jgi:hypothetical protein